MHFIALLFGVCFGLVAYVIFRRFSSGHRPEDVNVDERLGGQNKYTSVSLLRKKNALSEIELINKLLLSQHAAADNISVLLKTARLKISVFVFLLACFLGGGVTYILLQFKVSSLVAFVMALLAALLPLFYLRHTRKNYLAKFAEHLPNALSIISGAIRAGNSLESAISIAARTAPYPVSAEFDVAQSEMKLGIPLQTALSHLHGRVKNQEFKIMTTGISIHQELGGNLGEILNNLEKTIRERFALIREIHTLSAQGRYSAWVLFAIPFALMVLYMKSNPKQFLEFLSSGYGGALMGICLFLDVVGFLWIRRIVQLKD